MRKAWAVGRKELRQIARDRRTLAILLLVPVGFLLLFGYALNFDVKNVRMAVQDRDHSAESRALVSAFLNSGYFQLAGAVRDAGELNRLLELPLQSHRESSRRPHAVGAQRSDSTSDDVTTQATWFVVQPGGGRLALACNDVKLR